MRTIGQLTTQIMGDLFASLLDENQKLREMSLAEFAQFKGYQLSGEQLEQLEQLELSKQPELAVKAA